MTEERKHAILFLATTLAAAVPLSPPAEAGRTAYHKAQGPILLDFKK